MKNYKNFYYPILALIFLVFPPVTFFDTAWYHKYSEIFEGTAPWSNWDFVRGIGYPFFLFLSHKIFGYSGLGMEITLAIAFLITAFYFEKITQHYGFSIKASRCAFMGLFLFNPAYLGYSHATLTESLFFPISLAFTWCLVKAELRSWRFYLVTGLLLFFSYQLKENYIFLLLPLLCFYKLPTHLHRRCFIIAGLIALMLMGNAVTRFTLRHLSKNEAVSAGYNALMDGTSFGGMRGSVSQDIPWSGEFIEKIEYSTDALEACGVKKQSGKIYHFFTREGEIRCPVPVTIFDALKIRAYLTYRDGFKVIPEYLSIFLEELGVIKNRYDENYKIGLFSIGEASNPGASNIRPIDAQFDYQKFVDPYRVHNSNSFFIIRGVYKILSKIALPFTSLVYVFTILFFFAQFFTGMLAAEILWLSSTLLAYFLFSAAFGLINDRYIFSCYPLAGLTVALGVNTAFQRCIKSMKG